MLPDEQEDLCQLVLEAMKQVVYKRGITVQAFFDDQAKSAQKSIKLFGHLTETQFCRVLNAGLGWVVSEKEAKVLCDKFRHEEKSEFINYLAFSYVIDPVSTPGAAREPGLCACVWSPRLCPMPAPLPVDVMPSQPLTKHLSCVACLASTA